MSDPLTRFDLEGSYIGEIFSTLTAEGQLANFRRGLQDHRRRPQRLHRRRHVDECGMGLPRPRPNKE